LSDAAEQLRALAAASLFPTEGELRLPGLTEPAEIRRDAWGVPYVRAESLDDLWFAQGVVTAGERLFQVDLTLRAATGRLSELFGERTYPQDELVRVVGMRHAATRQAAAWDPESRRMHARFREGIAAWVAAMPSLPLEYTLLDARPELPDDEASWAAAFVYVAWSLSGNWDIELLRASIEERLGAEAVDELLPPAGAVRGQGSNAWAVAGSATASGRPLLANDPHLLITQPGAWFPLHLSAPGYQARGVAFTFSPGIVLGATPHHAWGVTNVGGDVQDLYLERLDDDRRAARLGDGWEPLDVRREEIVVRGEPEPRVVEVVETRHGPLLRDRLLGFVDPEHVPLRDDETYALRWTGLERTVVPSFVVRLANADGPEAFGAAAAELECPGQNFVYADVDGHIAYRCTGAYPIRSAGDGTRPVPGWDDEHEWIGTVPVAELPASDDPADGRIVTANDRPHADAFPHLLGQDFHVPDRAERIRELLGARTDHDVASMAAMQVDTVSRAARRTLPSLISVSAGGERGAAIDTLRTWDGDLLADSAAAAIYNVWSRHLARRRLLPRLGERTFAEYHAWREPFQCALLPEVARRASDDELLRALDDALDELRETLGADLDAWTWGAIHRLRAAHPLASIPGLEPLFVAIDAPVGGDEQTVSQTGFDGRDGYDASVVASWRAVWDLGDLDRSVGIVPTGVSGNPASPHWADQAERYLRGDTIPLPVTPEAVDAATVAVLVLTPG
jgi:penicillin amidase